MGFLVAGGGSDPVFHARRFLAMRERPGFPEQLKDDLKDLESRADAIPRSAERHQWVVFYEDLLEVARDALARVRGVAPNHPSPGPQVNPGPAPWGGGSSQSVRRQLSDLEKSDRDAVAYIINDRVPRQRNTEVKLLIEELTDDLPTEVSLVGNILEVRLSQDATDDLRAKIEEACCRWKEKVLSGTATRVERHREPVLRRLQPGLAAIGLTFPEIPLEVRSDRLPSPKLPRIIRGKVPTWPEAAWKFFRSMLGMVFLFSMIVVPLGLSLGLQIKKEMVIIPLVPLFLLIASIQATRNRRSEAEQVSERLKGELQKLIGAKLREFADQYRQDILGAIRRFQARNDQALKLWLFDVEEREQRMVGAVVAAPTPEVVVEAGGSIRNQAIAEQLADRIIPAIEARLAELAESGAG
jgi:hypothetical protein